MQEEKHKDAVVIQCVPFYPYKLKKNQRFTWEFSLVEARKQISNHIEEDLQRLIEITALGFSLRIKAAGMYDICEKLSRLFLIRIEKVKKEIYLYRNSINRNAFKTRMDQPGLQIINRFNQVTKDIKYGHKKN